MSKPAKLTYSIVTALAVSLLLPSCTEQEGHEGHEHDKQAMDGPMHGGNDDHMHSGNDDHMHKDNDDHMHKGNNSANRQPSGQVKDGVRVVSVTAKKFEFTPSTIIVKQGEPVRLEVTSQDVEHGLQIKDFGIEKPLPPKETVEFEFTPEDPGSHHFHCSVYCGKGHDQMHGELIVLETEK